MMLLEKKTYAYRKTFACRKDWSVEFHQPKELKLKRGGSRKLKLRNVMAIVWHNNRDVLLISTNSHLREDAEVERKSGRDREKV